MTQTPSEEPAAEPAAAQPAETPPAETPSAQAPPAEAAPAAATPATTPRGDFYRGRPFQVGLAAVAGLLIGGVGGLGIGFAAGHFVGGDRHRPHGFYQDGPRRDHMPMQPPRKVNPQKPLPFPPSKPGLPGTPAPTASPTA